MTIEFPPDFKPKMTTPLDGLYTPTPSNRSAPHYDIVPLMSIKFPPDFRPLSSTPKKRHSHSGIPQARSPTPDTAASSLMSNVRKRDDPPSPKSGPGCHQLSPSRKKASPSFWNSPSQIPDPRHGSKLPDEQREKR